MLETATIATLGLYLLRTGALLLSAPIFSTGSSFTGYRVALGVLVFALLALRGVPGA